MYGQDRFDMKEFDTPPTQQESTFGIDELFFSTTDKKGIITAGNTVFARVSGYAITELLGKPHNIVRHPGMPRVVFKLLWDSLEARKPLAAYVKNLAKNRSYYWVVALAIPITDGYLSIRFKPSSRFFPLIQGVYQDLREVEQEFEADGRGWKSGMGAAAERLAEILTAHGFGNYEAFMHTMLREEIKSRQTMLRDGGFEVKSPQDRKERLESATMNVSDRLDRVYRLHVTVANHINTLFARTDDYVSLHEKLQGKSTFILELANSIRLFSLNAAVEATRLGERGKTLNIIATQLEEHAQAITKTVTLLTRQMFALGDALKVVVFDLAVAKLQLDMATVFTSELLNAQQGQDAVSNDAEVSHVTSKIRTLEGAFAFTSRKALQLLKTISDELRQMSGEAERLHEVIQTLRIVHLNGKVEAAGVGSQTRFPVILEEVSVLIQRATEELYDLMNSIAIIRGQLVELPSRDLSISLLMREIESEVEKIQEAP